ncbi:hypothetical protein EIN_327260 [Entamoeba invadens IP1]|uniref:PPM-type phosphatase domain-containing protein n=1 Tax=Entamoeba invadens IP1 TaxID=370355 RepID=A0A0A1TXK0_ENTIV|nr:hypothetical protein EIN_327260 [Entamoeba invadens IP1]ELP86079.1 hypothetical protein EIN_327260 [Entamoeba invadens IP1]|eukprot:XP_004185425.1 hypothetical protein EIN_327260 [Entamoeba invadens IP1]
MSTTTLLDIAAIHKTFTAAFSSKVKRIKQSKIIPFGDFIHTTNFRASKDICRVVGKENLFSLTSFNAYGFLNGVKQGDPNCDKVAVRIFKHGSCCVMCDGCGWSHAAYLAALDANENALEHFTSNVATCNTLQDIAQLLVDCCEQAHISIFRKGVLLFDLGLTTITLSVVAKTQTGHYHELLISIGDCRTFLYSPRTHHTLPLSGRFHKSFENMKNSYGAIGPSISFHPNLKKAELKNITVEPNDMLIIMTDGFHDNFDPQFTGAVKYKSKEREADKLFTSKIELPENKNDLNQIVITLSQHVADLTEPSRKYIRETGKKLTSAPTPFHGKMDHATVCLLKVCDVTDITNFQTYNIVPPYNEMLLNNSQSAPKEEQKVRVLSLGQKLESDKPGSVFKKEANSTTLLKMETQTQSRLCSLRKTPLLEIIQIEPARSESIDPNLICQEASESSGFFARSMRSNSTKTGAMSQSGSLHVSVIRTEKVEKKEDDKRHGQQTLPRTTNHFDNSPRHMGDGLGLWVQRPKSLTGKKKVTSENGFAL